MEHPKQVKAPWSLDQCVALARFQDCEFMHPFTCGNCQGVVLRPTPHGWLCIHNCGWDQDWAHNFMFEPPVDPLAALHARGQTDAD
ncbi:hypothetical protein LCGC14_0723110 [marine sediment metagenome]|uniref:Uncharacterized protein n=1 Tax=marine sediment metagenome TaxID=412755 RepID=A0A0F9QBT1_9ZZZZ